MGLDMYLSASKYIGCWNHSTATDKAQYRAVAEATGLGNFKCDGAPGMTVNVDVAYWRKANAVHAWFVHNVQNDMDGCQTSDVSREQLEQLVADCKKVLDSIETVEGEVRTGTSWYPDGRVEQHTKPGEVVAQTGLAQSIMPTQSGFFFGKTDYDEDYLTDLRDTVKMISALLKDRRFKGWDFQYHASW